MANPNGGDPRRQPEIPTGATDVSLGTTFRPEIATTLVQLTIGRAQLSFPHDQAEALGHQLLMVAGRARAETMVARAAGERGMSPSDTIEYLAAWRRLMAGPAGPPPPIHLLR